MYLRKSSVQTCLNFAVRISTKLIFAHYIGLLEKDSPQTIPCLHTLTVHEGWALIHISIHITLH